MSSPRWMITSTPLSTSSSTIPISSRRRRILHAQDLLPQLPQGFILQQALREHFGDFLHDGNFNVDNQTKCDQLRAPTTKMHSGRFIEYSTKTTRGLVYHRLLVLLDSLSMVEKSLNLQDVFLRFTFDNIYTAAFGVDPSCLTVDLPVIPLPRLSSRRRSSRCVGLPYCYLCGRMKYLKIGTENHRL